MYYDKQVTEYSVRGTVVTVDRYVSIEAGGSSAQALRLFKTYLRSGNL